MLVIAVDTLTIAEGTTTIVAPGVSIVARSIQVSGSATLDIQGGGLQLVTAGISGSLAVAFLDGAGAPVGAPTPLVLSGVASPQVLTVSVGGALAVATDASDIADVVHPPWSILSVQISSAIAGVLVDEDTLDAMNLAAGMVAWVTGCGQALLQEQAAYANVDFVDVASFVASAIGLLTYTQAAASGATYVPILSTDLYQSQITALLAVAATYDQQITAWQSQENLAGLLSGFTATLQFINSQAETPLLTTLGSLASQSALLETQVGNACVQLDLIVGTLPDLQQALVQAIQDQFQQELVTTALDVFTTVATLYLGAGAALVGDPEILAGNTGKMLKAALEIGKEFVTAGRTTIASAINEGAAAATTTPTGGSLATSQQGAQVMAASIASFGQASSTLWSVVGAAIANAPRQIDFSPDFLSAVAQMPDISGFSTGGLDPVTYWNAIVVQTQAAIQPNATLPAAVAYLEAVQLCATYGASLGDLQMKLLDLYTAGIDAFMRLQAAYQARAAWSQLQSALVSEEDQAAAAIGLLQRGYLDVKRQLVAAVGEYRAAFQYQWLQTPSIQVDVSMDFLTLQQQAQGSVTSLASVLAGTTGGLVRPRQTFTSITSTIQQGAGPLFTNVNGQGQARWSIPITDTSLSSQLAGNTAIYLTEATFALVGGTQSGSVQLAVATSGSYDNQLGTSVSRFVSQPVSMTNIYAPTQPPTYTTKWEFADASAYMAPAPYTDWTLTVLEGNWQDVTSITMTLSGLFLQNA